MIARAIARFATRPSLLRLGIVVVAAAALSVGAVRLLTAVPWGGYHPLFWDCGALIQGIQNDGFPTGRGVVTGEYAILKWGYALPYWWLYRQEGLDATLLIGLFWFSVLLIAPVLSPLFHVGGRPAWTGYLCYASCLVAMPIVHKYIGMANPTIQAMALWALLVLIYPSHRGLGDHGTQRGTIAGFISGLIVVTDYKWFPFCVMGIMIIETWECLVARDYDWRALLRSDTLRISRNIGIAVVGMGVVVGAVALSNNAYLASITRYVTNPGKVAPFRPDLSWSLGIILWVLGGFWLALWTAWRLWERRTELLFGHDARSQAIRRALILALLMVLGFSVIYWPRSARMFAPAVVLVLIIFAAKVEDVVRAPQSRTRMALVPVLSLLAIQVGVLIRSVDAGECFRLESGIEEVGDYLADHREELGQGPIGCYLPPVFTVSMGDSFDFVFLPAQMPISMNWIVASEFVDRVVIDEQLLFRNSNSKQRQDAMQKRDTLSLKSQSIASFPNDFYCSSYFICESNYTDLELARALTSGSEAYKPAWEIRYVGELFGRPPLSNVDKSH